MEVDKGFFLLGWIWLQAFADTAIPRMRAIWRWHSLVEPIVIEFCGLNWMGWWLLHYLLTHDILQIQNYCAWIGDQSEVSCHHFLCFSEHWKKLTILSWKSLLSSFVIVLINIYFSRLRGTVTAWGETYICSGHYIPLWMCGTSLLDIPWEAYN